MLKNDVVSIYGGIFRNNCIFALCCMVISSFQEWANAIARRPSSVRLSVCPSVNFCANRFFSQTNGRIATKLAHDGLQVSVHPGCAQGQGHRSRDMRTFLDSWNELLRHWRSGIAVAMVWLCGVCGVWRRWLLRVVKQWRYIELDGVEDLVGWC